MSIPMSTMYGYDTNSLDDPLIAAAHTSTNIATSLLLPGATFINIFPVLAYVPVWFPGASSRKMAETVRDFTEKMESTLFKFVKNCTVSKNGHGIRYAQQLVLIFNRSKERLPPHLSPSFSCARKQTALLQKKKKR